jgi:hypothetical protein
MEPHADALIQPLPPIELQVFPHQAVPLVGVMLLRHWDEIGGVVRPKQWVSLKSVFL